MAATKAETGDSVGARTPNAALRLGACRITASLATIATKHRYIFLKLFLRS
jgi:hypothetical protein